MTTLATYSWSQRPTVGNADDHGRGKSAVVERSLPVGRTKVGEEVSSLGSLNRSTQQTSCER